MMPYFRIYVLTAIFIIGFSARSVAQLGLQVGWNTSGYTYSNGGVKQERGLNWGVNAGILYRIGIVKHLALQPTLLYSQKGATNNNNGTTYVTGVSKYVNKLNYLEFSLPVLIRLPFAHKCSFDFGAGPYAGKLLSAISKRVDLNGDKTNIKFKIGNDTTDDFTPFDLGLSVYAGTRFSHFNMCFSYDIGMADVNPAGGAIKNGCFNINLGVFF